MNYYVYKLLVIDDKNKWQMRLKYFFPITIIMMVIVCSILSCEKREKNLNSPKEYLYVSGVRPDQMTKNDVVIMVRAFKRMEIVDSCGVWIRKTRTANEINVSENIFNILVSLVDHHNAVRNFEGTKSSGDLPNDCVAKSLLHLGDYSLVEINYYINMICGGAVTIYNIDNLLHHFYPGYVTYSPDSLGGSESFSSNTTVAYFFTGGTGSQHMVNVNYIIESSDSSYVWYYDAQNQCTGVENLYHFGRIYKLK